MNNRGLSPLHVSAIKGFVEFCDILIQYGADVNIVCTYK